MPFSDDRADLDSDNENGEWGPDTNESETELVVMTPEDQALPNSRIRLLQIMVRQYENVNCISKIGLLVELS